jgi:predicted metal-dependent HD superfamily phosphohydrolase
VRESIAAHLETCGSWRLPAFVELTRSLMGDPDVLHTAGWCHETCYAVTKDGNEHRFFSAWERAAKFLQRQGVYSGEGGIMGLAAAYAGWTTDYETLAPIFPLIHHEGGGPKET